MQFVEFQLVENTDHSEEKVDFYFLKDFYKSSFHFGHIQKLGILEKNIYNVENPKHHTKRKKKICLLLKYIPLDPIFWVNHWDPELQVIFYSLINSKFLSFLVFVLQSRGFHDQK